MTDLIEFEPGASEPLFVQLRESETGPIVAAIGFMLSVSFTEPALCVPLVGTFDATREGWAIDLNELADLVAPRVSYKCYLYADYGQGWKSAGELKIKPKVGCIWQPLV